MMLASRVRDLSHSQERARDSASPIRTTSAVHNGSIMHNGSLMNNSTLQQRRAESNLLENNIKGKM
jgi:glutamine phosphoribosylpyrophosphate amidotransferase